MINKILNAKKILIIGDSGRGKTTFSQKLSKKLNLPLYSTDDYYWKVRFTEPNDKQESIQKIGKVYSGDTWLVEGGAIHLIRPGLEHADVIINLVFRNIFEQWWSLIQRNKLRKDENLLKHLGYVTRKRFGIGNDKEKRKRELLQPFSHKILVLDSYKKMDAILIGKR